MKKVTLSIAILLSALVSNGQDNKINNKGNIGIGTTNPQTQLHVNGDGRIRLSQAGTNVHWDINNAGSKGLEFKNVTNGISAMVINNKGNLGIGVSYPKSKLHISDENPNIIIESTGVNLPFGMVYNSQLKFKNKDNSNANVSFESGYAWGSQLKLENGNSNLLLMEKEILIGFEHNEGRNFNQKVSLNKPWVNEMAIGGKFADGYNLSVKGKSIFEQIEVQLQSDWPDYVFDESYELRPLEDVENFILANSHLPEVPSAKIVQENGINIAEMNAILMRKIEELTLYNIELNKKIIQIESRIK